MRTDVAYMQPCHLDDLLEIETACSDWNVWQEQDFRRVMTTEQSEVGRVVSLGRKVVGFVVYELGRDTLTILNVAIHPAYHRFGYGTQLIESLTTAMASQKRSRIVVTVCESNTRAQLFFKAMGFHCVDMHADYYHTPSGDLYGYEFVYSSVEELASTLKTKWRPENRISAYYDNSNRKV